MDELQPQTPSQDEIDLLDLAKKIWAQRVPILKKAGVGAIIGLVVAFSIPKEFTTTVKMAPEGINATQGGGMADLAAMAGINLSSNKGAMEGINLTLYPDVVYSTPFLVELSQIPVKGKKMDSTMTLYNYLDQEVSAPWWSSVISAPMKFLGWTMSLFSEKEKASNTLNPAALTKEQSEVIRCLNDWIAVSVDKKTGVITASTTAQDPVIAATVADSLVNKLQEYIYTYRTEKAVRDLKFTQELYNEAKEKYYEAQRRYAYASDANTYVAKKAAAVELVRLQNEQQLTFSIYNQMAQQLEQAKVKVQEQTPCVTIIEPASVPVKKSNASKVMILGAFIFLGGCFGAGKVVVRELFMKKEEERG